MKWPLEPLSRYCQHQGYTFRDTDGRRVRSEGKRCGRLRPCWQHSWLEPEQGEQAGIPKIYVAAQQADPW